jgi:hypothetical protein
VPTGAAEPAAVGPAAEAGAPTVFAQSAAAGGLDGLSGDFAKGALFGAVVALLGAVVGGAIGRRR